MLSLAVASAGSPRRRVTSFSRRIVAALVPPRALDVWVVMLLPLRLPDGVSQIQPQCCCCAEAASLPGEEEVPMDEDGCCRGISPTACCMFPSQYCCCVDAVAMPCDEEVPMLFHKFQPQCCRCVRAAALPCDVEVPAVEDGCRCRRRDSCGGQAGGGPYTGTVGH